MVYAVVGSSVRVEHLSADRMELGGGGGIRNHNGQHVSVHVFDNLRVQVLTQHFTSRCLSLFCAVVGSLMKSRSSLSKLDGRRWLRWDT